MHSKNIDKNKMRMGNKESIRDKVGGAVEKLGDKVSGAGATKLGQKIHNLGDKIERQHKNPQHGEQAGKTGNKKTS